jgi:hypothetical protein
MIRNVSFGLCSTALALSVVMLGLMLGPVWAQNSKPALPAGNTQLIRLQIGNSHGLGGGNRTTVEPFFMIAESEGVFNNKYFHRKVKSTITKRAWENLEQGVDAKALALAPQAVCHAVSDGPCSWLTVEFSDTTKIHLFYDWPNPPAAVAALLRQIEAIRLEVNRRTFQQVRPVSVPNTALPTPAAGAIANAAAAKKRAEQVLASKKWLSPPLKAQLKDGIWTVMGTTYCQEALPQPKFACYGGAGVRLRRSDGAILEVLAPHN